MKSSNDRATDVVAGFDPRGCRVCRKPLVERHRIKLKNWGGKYERGNVILLCPTHHKLMHVLINWWYTQAIGQWKPWPKGGDCLSRGEQLLRLVRYCHAKEPRLMRLYWRKQHPVVCERITKVTTGTKQFWTEEVSEVEQWKHSELSSHQFQDWEE